VSDKTGGCKIKGILDFLDENYIRVLLLLDFLGLF